MRCLIPLLLDKPFRQTKESCRFSASLRRTLRNIGGLWETLWINGTVSEALGSIHDPEPDPAHHISRYSFDFHTKTRIGIHLIRVGAFDIARYSFQAPQQTIKGQILLLHGYVLHSLCQASFISHLVAEGWEVIAIDWPGHGISSGKRANISDFSVYSQVLSSVIDTIDRSGKAPLHLIAHSTGCAAWIEYMLNGFPDPFNKVILISPLLRNAAWHVSVTGVRVAKTMGWSLVPRIFRKSSHDTDYLKLVRQDPLAPWVLPIQWSQSLIRWEKKLHKTTPFQRPVTIFQGTHDTVVDWKYGLRSLRRIFPRASIIRCKGQRHDLLNEKLPARRQVFEAIDRVLCPPIYTDQHPPEP